MSINNNNSSNSQRNDLTKEGKVHLLNRLTKESLGELAEPKSLRTSQIRNGSIPPLDLEAIREDEDDTSGETDTTAGEWTVVSHRKGNLSTILVNPTPMLQLTVEDVELEIEYWETAVFGYVLGANPPWEVLSGCLKCIWKARDIEKISFHPNDISLSDFQNWNIRSWCWQRDFICLMGNPSSSSLGLWIQS